MYTHLKLTLRCVVQDPGVLLIWPKHSSLLLVLRHGKGETCFSKHSACEVSSCRPFGTLVSEKRLPLAMDLHLDLQCGTNGFSSNPRGVQSLWLSVTSTYTALPTTFIRFCGAVSCICACPAAHHYGKPPALCNGRLCEETPKKIKCHSSKHFQSCYKDLQAPILFILYQALLATTFFSTRCFNAYMWCVSYLSQ